MKYATITGIGSFLPGKPVGNDFFAKYLDTTDEWIQSRTGIKTRYFIDQDVKLVDLALPACKQALENAKKTINDIDMIILATTTPDRFMPATACKLQELLGAKNIPAFDIQAVCSGFVYALNLAETFINAGKQENILVVGADIYSRILDFNDRGTCILFGDGAGAVVLSASDTPGILASNFYADGSQSEIIKTDGFVNKQNLIGKACFEMDGQKVFKLAIKTMEESSLQVCQDAKVDINDITYLVAHQANLRILNTLGNRLKIDPSKVVQTVTEHANTSAASIPLALYSIWDKLQEKDLVLMTAAGGGFTWGSVLWQV